MSTRGDYAARALLSLALHADHEGPTSVRDIAERTGLPQPYLEQILLALKGAGLVRSKRGVGGGYVLARPPGEITLGEIVSAVDGPIVVGDFEGYLHWLDMGTGEILARHSTDGDRITNAPVVADGIVYVLTDSGTLAAFRREEPPAAAPG